MTAKLLVAAIAITLSGLAGAEECEKGVCNYKFGEWSVATTPSFFNAVTSSPTGGLLSYICEPGKPRCQWAVMMPDADCQAGGKVGVSIKGLVGLLIVSANCNIKPEIGWIPGAGRSLAMDGDSGLISHAISIQDITITTTGAKNQLIAHRFSSAGAKDAIANVNLVLGAHSIADALPFQGKWLFDKFEQGGEKMGEASVQSDVKDKVQKQCSTTIKTCVWSVTLSDFKCNTGNEFAFLANSHTGSSTFTARCFPSATGTSSRLLILGNIGQMDAMAKAGAFAFIFPGVPANNFRTASFGGNGASSALKELEDYAVKAMKIDRRLFSDGIRD